MSTPVTGSVPPDHHPARDRDPRSESGSSVARGQISHPQLHPGLEDERTTGSPVLEEAVLSVRDLNIVYEVGDGVHAVKDASFTLRRGEILGLAGESGCGKTTLAYGLNQLPRPPVGVTPRPGGLHDRDDGRAVRALGSARP